jgi:hypothetical protein
MWPQRECLKSIDGDRFGLTKAVVEETGLIGFVFIGPGRYFPELPLRSVTCVTFDSRLDFNRAG